MFWDLVQKLIPGLTGVDRLAAVFTAAFGALSDARMWRSLGWIVLGIALMILAVVWFAGSVLGRVAPDAASVGSVAALAA